MVVNDRPPVAVAPPEREGPKKKKHVLSVVGVQCLSCLILVALAVLLRLAGGSAYRDFRQTFHDYLMRNDLLAALSTLWEGDTSHDAFSSFSQYEGEGGAAIPSEDVPPPADESLAVGRSTPEGTVAVPLRVTIPARPPLTDGTLTSAYGYRENPTGVGEQFHRGVDIAAPAGTAIVAMYSGRVIQVGEDKSLGRFVRLDHGDGVEILYAHCSQVLAAQGMCVRAGDRVALVGATGDVTGSHLHVQVSCDGVVYNPASMVTVERYA